MMSPQVKSTGALAQTAFWNCAWLRPASCTEPVISWRPEVMAADCRTWVAKKMIPSCSAASSRNSNGVIRMANSTAVAARSSLGNRRSRCSSGVGILA